MHSPIDVFAASEKPSEEPARQNGVPYENPVLRGFYPDPSVIRVGDDYYLVNSTFQFFPSIVISHSNDLVHWTQIGHVFDERNPLHLRDFNDGCGVWAPDLSYHDGWYYIFYCLVQLTKDRAVNIRGNFAVRARSLRGPFTEPVQLTNEGNDPSHFVDVDHSHYLVYAAGLPLGRGTKIVKLNSDCTKTVGDPHWMEWGIDRRAPEGPHIFRRGEYYYHTMAAGSGRFDGHHQLIARSKHLLGPYEESPFGPFIAQRNTRSPLQQQGHAKLVTTPNGDWWAMYLLQRRIKGYSPLGRETALDPVHWTDDGWPVLNEGHGPGTGGIVRGATPSAFLQASATSPWITIRQPLSAEMIRFEDDGDTIHMHCSDGWLSSTNPGSVLLRRETSHQYRASVQVEFQGEGPEEAGVTCYYDTVSHLSFGISGPPNARRVNLCLCKRGVSTTLASAPIGSSEHVGLAICVQGLSRSFSVTFDDGRQVEIATIEDASFLSDEGTPHWGFTGTLVGLYALNRGSGKRPTATFRVFTIANEP